MPISKENPNGVDAMTDAEDAPAALAAVPVAALVPAVQEALGLVDPVPVVLVPAAITAARALVASVAPDPVAPADLALAATTAARVATTVAAQAAREAPAAMIVVRATTIGAMSATSSPKSRRPR